MNVEILSIGDELLIGQTVNTNASWMGELLSLNGFTVRRITSIADEAGEIRVALDELSKRADIVLITGGLGPTRDDITKKTLAEYFGTRLIRNEEVLGRIEQYFKARHREMLEANRQQADLPENCVIIPNHIGTASGMWFEKTGKIYVSMPGVPYEMKHIMEQVVKMLKEKFSPEVIVHRTILTQGIGESFLAEKIKGWEDELRKENLSLAYLPSPGIVRLRITGKGNNEAALLERVDHYEKLLLPLIRDWFFGYEKDKLEEETGKLLMENKSTLSLAESCTGGYLSHLITSVPGSSSYFIGSVISYSNTVKTDQLSVNEDLIEKYGAVSEEVVKAMAEGVRELLKTDYSIAVSGIAGPDGGTEDKPVGTVWIAVADSSQTIAKKYHFETDRKRNIIRTALTGMMMLRKLLLNKTTEF